MSSSTALSLHPCTELTSPCPTLVCLLLRNTIAAVFQSYHASDMMHEMRRKPEPTPLPTQGILNLPYQEAWYYKEWPLMLISAQLNVMATTDFVPLFPGPQPSALAN